MTTSLKKLLLISITLLLGVMSNVVMAQTTNYDFSFTGNNGSITGGALTVNAGIVTAISGTVVNYNGVYTAGITGLGSFEGADNTFGSTSPYVNYNGLSFTTASYSYNLYYDSGGSGQYLLDSSQYPSGTPPTSAGSNSSLIVTQVGAPEIDGSLAPKVGFLLGCLFLMFGRKKQNTEQMMTA